MWRWCTGNSSTSVLVFSLLLQQFAISIVLSQQHQQQQFLPQNQQQQQQQQQQPQNVVRTFAPIVLNGGGDGRNLPRPPPGFALVPTFAGPFLVPINNNDQRPALPPPSSALVRPSRDQLQTSRPNLQAAFLAPNGQQSPQGGFQPLTGSGEIFQTNQNVQFQPNRPNNNNNNNNARPPIVDFFNPFLSSTQPLFPFHQQQSLVAQQQQQPNNNENNQPPRLLHTNEHLSSVFREPVESNFRMPPFSQNLNHPADFSVNTPISSAEQQQSFELPRPGVVVPPVIPNTQQTSGHQQRPPANEQNLHFSPVDTTAHFNPDFVNNQATNNFAGSTELVGDPPSHVLSNFDTGLLTNHQPSTTTSSSVEDGSRQTLPQHVFTGLDGFFHNPQQSGESHGQLPPHPPSSSEQTSANHFFSPPQTSQGQGNTISGSSENAQPHQFFPSSEIAQGNDFSGGSSSENLPPSSSIATFPPTFPMAPLDLFSVEVATNRPEFPTSDGRGHEDVSSPQPQDIGNVGGGEEIVTSHENSSPFRHHITEITPSSFFVPSHHQSPPSGDTQEPRQSPPQWHHTTTPSSISQHVPGTDQLFTFTLPTFPQSTLPPVEPTTVHLPPPNDPSPFHSTTTVAPLPVHATASISSEDETPIQQSPGFAAILNGLHRHQLNPQDLLSGEDQLQKPQSTTSTTSTSTTTTTTTRRPGRTRGRLLSRRPVRPAVTTQQTISFQNFPDSSEQAVTSTLSSGPIFVESQRSASSTPLVVGSDATSCEPSKCQLPDCFCGGNKLSPGDLDPSEIPQMVLLTFDDSVNEINYHFYTSMLKNGGRKNPNGCPIRATFYVSHEWTDYGKIQTLYSQGHELASHSISHSDGAPFSKERWFKEIYGQKKILSALGGVKVGDIRGMRAPFLQPGGNKQFAMLYESNFTYDSSIPSHVNKPPTWPYTLDYRLPHQCGIPPCPTKSYPGVWEVPMVMWEDLKGGHCAMADACQNPSDARGVYDMLVKNFKRHYTSNRAPFGMFYHYAWFTHDHHREGFLAFLDAILQLPDVYFVTNSQMLEWMRHPTPLSQIENFGPWQCNSEQVQACSKPKRCSYRFKGDERQFPTCRPCPDTYPWLETYDNLAIVR